MANFIRELMRTEPHTIEEIRASLDSDLSKHKQFIPILRAHHDYMLESVSYLLDNETTDFQKQEHLERLFRLIEMHSKAEQEVLYNHLKANSNKEVRIEGLSGQEEHDLIFQLQGELTGMGYWEQWTEETEGKARILAALIRSHLNDEENSMYPIAVNNMTELELEDMRDAYLQKCMAYLINDRAEDIYAGDWKMGIHTDAANFHE